jgi:hypothetical protein
MQETTETVAVKQHRDIDTIIIEWCVYSNTIGKPVTGEELDQFGSLISPELKIWVLLRQIQGANYEHKVQLRKRN